LHLRNLKCSVSLIWFFPWLSFLNSTTFLNCGTSLIVREAAKVWPGNKKVHFKNNATEALKLEELVSRLEQTYQIPKIGFGGGMCLSQDVKGVDKTRERL